MADNADVCSQLDLGNGVLVGKPPPYAVAVEGDGMQLLAVLKCAAIDMLISVADDYLFQCLSICEGIGANLLHAIWYVNLLDAVAPEECRPSYTGKVIAQS